MGFKARNRDTDIVCIIDKSGSMMHLTDDTIGGFNNFLKDQKAQIGKANITVVLFDTEYSVFYSGDLQNAPELNSRSYRAMGATALFDAIGKAIGEADNRVKKNQEVVFCIITDGHENSSVEFDNAAVKELIESRQNAGWNFVFLGADQEAIASAVNFGVLRHNTAQYDLSSAGVKSSYSSFNNAVNQTRSLGRVGNWRDKNLNHGNSSVSNRTNKQQTSGKY